MIIKIGDKQYEINRILSTGFKKHNNRWYRINFYEINCRVCAKPKSIREDALIRGIALAHMSCSQKKIQSYSEQQTKELVINTVRSLYTNRLRDNNNRRIIIKFELNNEEIESIIFKQCHYCGTIPSQKCYKHKIFYTGIDRIDSNKDYIIDNCVPCCGICNRAKNTMSVKDFEKWMSQLVKFRQSKGD